MNEELNNSEINEVLKGPLNNSLKEMMRILNAECGSLFLFDSQNKELVLNSFYNSKDIPIRGLKKRMGEGISGKVVDIKRPVLVKNIDKDLRFRRNGFSHYKTKSFISIPLITSKGLLGLINLADKSSGESFTDNDLEAAVTISRYACLLIDNLYRLTTLRQEKEDLDKQNSLLEKYASVGKLAAAVVHEVNNPLDGVIRYTNMLLTQTQDNSTGQKYLLEIKNGLNRIANTTRSLLEFSYQINSHYSYARKYVNVHELINESLAMFLDKINARIEIKKDFQENLPKVLDQGLFHIIVNIIKNALDAMPNGGILNISTRIKDSMLEVCFMDTGIGIPEETTNRIFEPFFTTKKIGKGTGLGLAICKEIINKYEGRIGVRSLEGEGTAFTVLIPVRYFENEK